MNKIQSRGFTLIEVMVVLVILGILATLVVPRIMSRPDEARIIAAKQDINSIGQALKLYRLDNQNYPTTDQGLLALVTKPTVPPAPVNWKTVREKSPEFEWPQSTDSAPAPVLRFLESPAVAAPPACWS